MTSGLQAAARQVQSFGRGSDTMLAHVSPDEAKMVDYLQGGSKLNPHTGLPEYGGLGNILKALVRAAGAIVGFTVGGPLGAAAGSGITTKLTGGSWNDALKGAALSGIGGEVTQGLSDGGWSPTGGVQSYGSALNDFRMAGTPISQSAINNGLQAAGGGIGGALAPIGGYAGAVAGLGAMGADTPAAQAGPSLPAQSPINLNVQPSNRQYHGYEGDYGHYGEQGGGMGHKFFDPVNPMPVLNQPAPVDIDPRLAMGEYARGGRVRGYAFGGPAGPLGGQPLHQPGLRGPQGPQMAPGPGVPGTGIGTASPRQQSLLNAVSQGYSAFAKGGMVHRGLATAAIPSPAAMQGSVSGPGDGKSDNVPAMLSDGEHVFDASVTADAGNGSNNAGHKVMENIKTEIRRQARPSSASKPTKKINTAPHAVAAMVRRAKQKAGVTKIAPVMA